MVIRLLKTGTQIVIHLGIGRILFDNFLKAGSACIFNSSEQGLCLRQKSGRIGMG